MGKPFFLLALRAAYPAKDAITEAKSPVDKAGGLVKTAKAKKEELTKDWADLNKKVPNMVQTIQSRVNILSKSKKLPANRAADKFGDAKDRLVAAKEEWGKALESFKVGNFAEAGTMAQSVKDRATQIMEALGMSVPVGTKQLRVKY